MTSSIMKEFENLEIQLEKIISATNNFDKTKKIGSGGFGDVYEAEISHFKGTSKVAIKRLIRRNGQGDPEFLKEIAILSRCKHKNLITLLGFCDTDGEKILVYEHAAQGSLDLHLSSTNLTWTRRIKICLDAARGLSYLHDPRETHQRVIHRDIKSSNILLDGDWNAKVSDMGLSKIGPANQQYTALFTNVVGTHGYCDPRYFKTYTLTKESDVYSFGVVMFEVLCGRLCYQISNGQLQVLVSQWKQSYQEKKLDAIIFQGLVQPMDPIALETFSGIAFQCLQKSRPTMALVVEKLEIALKFQEPHDLRMQNEEITPLTDHSSIGPTKLHSKRKTKIDLMTQEISITEMGSRKQQLLKDQVCLVKRKDSDRYEIAGIQGKLAHEKGFFVVIRACQLLAQKNEGIILVGLAGPSGAGKTLFTEKILNFMPNVAVISMENYNDVSRLIDDNFDDSQLTDYDTLLKNICDLKEGKTVEVPIYDFNSSTRTGYTTLEVPSSRIVIIKGIYALSEKLRPLLDLRVSFSVGFHFGLVRRVLRDTQRVGKEPEERSYQISETAYPMSKAFIEPDLKTAHISIVNTVGEDIFVKLLTAEQSNTQANVCFLPACMMMEDASVCSRIVDADATKLLLKLLGPGNEAPVRAQAAAALKSFSAQCIEARKEIASSNGIPSLINAIIAPSKEFMQGEHAQVLQENAMCALANISGGLSCVISSLGQSLVLCTSPAQIADTLGVLASALMIYDSKAESSKASDPTVVELALIKQFKPKLPFLVQERTIEALASLYGNATLSSKLTNSDSKRLLVGLITMATNEVQDELIRSLLILYKNEGSLWYALQGQEGIQMLISLLGLSSKHQQECAVALLCLLSNENDESKWAITAASGIPPLVQILETGSPKAKEDSATILGNLCNHSEDIRACVESADAVPALLWLLKNGSSNGKEIAANDFKPLDSQIRHSNYKSTYCIAAKTLNHFVVASVCFYHQQV